MLKKLHQIWSAGVSLHLRAAQLVRYSSNQTLILGILFIRIHTVSPREFMGFIYAHSYGQSILVRFSAQCIQRTGLCVPWFYCVIIFFNEYKEGHNKKAPENIAMFKHFSK